MNIDSIRQTLTENLNKEKSKDVNVDINVNVISEANGKFAVQIHNSNIEINEGNIDKADITVGFLNKDTMIDMFLNGANPMSLVMKGQMTFNGDMQKGKSLKGLFIQ